MLTVGRDERDLGKAGFHRAAGGFQDLSRAGRALLGDPRLLEKLAEHRSSLLGAIQAMEGLGQGELCGFGAAVAQV